MILSMKDFIKATKVSFKFNDCYLEHSEHKLHHARQIYDRQIYD